MSIRKDLAAAVGDTPLIRLRKASEITGCEILGKAEFLNPGQSVKDRAALSIIQDAVARGELRPGGVIVEGTAGNTGIGLATVCAAKGYPFVCVMSEAFSIERRKMMRFVGAKVVLTNPAHKGSGMVIKARELATEHVTSGVADDSNGAAYLGCASGSALCMAAWKTSRGSQPRAASSRAVPMTRTAVTAKAATATCSEQRARMI